MVSDILKGKRGLIMGLANEKSLAWGIAQETAAHGADLMFTYPNEAIGRRIDGLLRNKAFYPPVPCDVTSDDSMEAAFQRIARLLNGKPLDFLVHAISYSDKAELNGKYISTSRCNFAKALDVSCYSLTAIARHALPLMSEGGSILTLSYLGAERVIPNYNVMGVAKAALEASVRYLAADLGPHGIRVNAISAGPVKTLASSGITGIREVVRWSERNAPLRRATSIADVGRAALSLVSDLGQGITGEVIHVDCGYHAIGMPAGDPD